MRHVYDGLMLHNVQVFYPRAEEATGSYQKRNFVILAGILNLTDNQIKKIRRGVIGSKDEVRSILEIIVILAEGFPAVLIYELNQQFADINKYCGIKVELLGLINVLLLFVRRIREQNAVPAVCFSPQLILVPYMKLKIRKLLLMIIYIGHRKFLYSYGIVRYSKRHR